MRHGDLRREAPDVLRLFPSGSGMNSGIRVDVSARLIRAIERRLDQPQIGSRTA